MAEIAMVVIGVKMVMVMDGDHRHPYSPLFDIAYLLYCFLIRYYLKHTFIIFTFKYFNFILFFS